jgi:hypothetical protein
MDGRHYSRSGVCSSGCAASLQLRGSPSVLRVGKIKMVAQVAAITLILGHQEIPFLPLRTICSLRRCPFRHCLGHRLLPHVLESIDGRFKAQERQRSILNEARARRSNPMNGILGVMISATVSKH